MTKRTNKPKATPTVAATINSTPPKQAVESVKAETKAKVASKGKQANSKAPAKPRARSKKALVEGHFKPTEENLTKLVESSEVAYQKYKETGGLSGTTRIVEPTTSKYEQFKAWLVYRLYVVTSYFRGY